jgi:hypothetical protein
LRIEEGVATGPPSLRLPSRAGAGRVYKQTQCAPARGKGQVLYRKRVMVNRTCIGLRQNKAKLGQDGASGGRRLRGGQSRRTKPIRRRSGEDAQPTKRVSCAKRSQSPAGPDGTEPQGRGTQGNRAEQSQFASGVPARPWRGYQGDPTLVIRAGGDSEGPMAGSRVLPAGGRLCHHRGRRVQKYCIRIDIGDVR